MVVSKGGGTWALFGVGKACQNINLLHAKPLCNPSPLKGHGIAENMYGVLAGLWACPSAGLMPNVPPLWSCCITLFKAGDCSLDWSLYPFHLPPCLSLQFQASPIQLQPPQPPHFGAPIWGAEEGQCTGQCGQYLPRPSLPTQGKHWSQEQSALHNRVK